MKNLILFFSLFAVLACEKNTALPTDEVALLPEVQAESPMYYLAEYMDVLGAFDPAESEGVLISWRTTSTEGDMDIEVRSVDDIDLNEWSSDSNADESTGPKGKEWEEHKTFSGAEKKARAAAWLASTFGDCSCIDTRTIIAGGDVTIYGECCD
ncbi:hypothetical protein FUA23_13555 [Neolewinella aurantiaca]|uniref:Uncharacterized protein n=1 Tax=Neolewinella aurantiaca TaxID=2602767 RepID=A0A5C7FV01_9BACT|nr:hypothetical protein [Neolewinella aurantiaca]TXF88687.1 hypothetical protein FUA23_13555 [Neolewinella aurantiaca]